VNAVVFVVVVVGGGGGGGGGVSDAHRRSKFKVLARLLLPISRIEHCKGLFSLL
jgi:hypothetical protein